MKIALAHEMLVKLGGAERVLKSLSDLWPEAPIYTLLKNKQAESWFSSKTIKTSKLNQSFLPRKFLLGKMPQAVENWNFNRYDVVISSSSAFMHGIKTDKKTRHICYCHSPMRYTWDYTHEYTEKYGDLMRFLIAQKLSPIRQWDYLTSDRPDILVANSNHVKKRIQKYWRKDAQVIYPPVNVKRFTPTAKNDDYFLIVSALTPFKRIDIAIEAFNKARRNLIIIGDGSQRKALEKLAGPTIQFLGHQSDKIITDYYQNCRAFVFPGEEDFGITPVEAMAAGKPVLAYGVGGVTESVQAGISGEFFNSPTAQSLEDGLARLIANEENYDIQKIRQIAEQFDESVFQDKMKQLITS